MLFALFSPMPTSPKPGERLHGVGDQHVGAHQDQGGDDGRDARGLAGVLGLLADRQAGVPAPVDEDAQDDRRGDRRVVQTARPQPGPVRLIAWAPAVPANTRTSAMMLTMISTPNWTAIRTFCIRSDTTMPRALTQRHGDDEERSEQHFGREVFGEVVEAEELEQVDRGDLGDVSQHDDRRHRQTPAADPADPRSERLGAPSERGAAVRGVLGELLIGERNQQHRDEREEEHRRRLVADGQHHVAQRGRQAVCGRDRREADDDVADQAERSCLQALAADSRAGNGSAMMPCAAIYGSANFRAYWTSV